MVLYEMANVSKQDTGLPYDIWIDSLGKDRKIEHNPPRIKVDVEGDLVPVSLEEEPRILVDKKIRKFSLIRKYIKKYLNIFFFFFNKEISDREALKLLNKLED